MLKLQGEVLQHLKLLERLHVHTSGGSITLDEIEGTIQAHTSGGRIRATEIHGEILAKTSGGSITLEDIIGNVEAKTSGGYDLNLDGSRVRADLSNFDGDYEKDEIEGTMNGGGTRLTAKTSGGSVTMRYL